VVAERTFEEVYTTYGPQIHRFCITQLGDPVAAEDVTATVFASVYAAFDRLPADADGVRPWIFRAARNAIIDHHRRRRTWNRMFSRLAATDHTASVESTAAVREELRLALQAISKLRRRDRELVGLRIGGRLSTKEIAAMFGMSEVATRTAINRALARVREQMASTE
jgi:RNA polymerase sigma-70 factor (ECF subfamily)